MSLIWCGSALFGVVEPQLVLKCPLFGVAGCLFWCGSVPFLVWSCPIWCSRALFGVVRPYLVRSCLIWCGSALVSVTVSLTWWAAPKTSLWPKQSLEAANHFRSLQLTADYCFPRLFPFDFGHEEVAESLLQSSRKYNWDLMCRVPASPWPKYRWRQLSIPPTSNEYRNKWIR